MGGSVGAQRRGSHYLLIFTGLRSVTIIDTEQVETCRVGFHSLKGLSEAATLQD